MTMQEILDKLMAVIQHEFKAVCRMYRRAVEHGCSDALTNDILEEVDWIYANSAYPSRVNEHTFKYAFRNKEA